MQKRIWGRNKKGFTLVELLVVIGIIGVLAAVILPNAFKALEKGKVAAAISDYRAIKSASLSYYSDTGMWPDDGADVEGFFTEPTGGVDGWDGPYLERWEDTNPWGGDYTYANEDGTVFGTTSTGERYLLLTEVNAKAIEKLEDQLGPELVVQDATEPTNVMLLISRD